MTGLFASTWFIKQAGFTLFNKLLSDFAVITLLNRLKQYLLACKQATPHATQGTPQCKLFLQY